MKKITIYTDGGARGNPGPAGAGIVMYSGEQKIEGIKKYLGDHVTNNWAEYEALIIALTKAQELKLMTEEVEVRLDSMLVVEQVKGNWKVKEPTLKPQVAKARELAAHFANISFKHIPREENSEADALVNEVLDEQ